MLAYVLDESLKREFNRNEQNYWDVYIQEINHQLGVSARALSLTQLEQGDALQGIKTLVVGCQSGARLNTRARENLERWVREGGILIGFALRGLDRLFGIETCSTLAQPVDDYTISGYFEFRLHPLTREVHPFMLVEQKVLVLSDIELVDLDGAVELAHLYDTEGSDLGHPAITWHSYGQGYAGYFCYDVAKTIWLLHQGKPLPAIPEGEYCLRTPQLQVLGQNSAKVAYADEMVYLLQNMIAQSGQPFIYQIPPDGDGIPDALLYYSGDEYTGPVELSLKASDFMAEKGLPYHINIAAEYHPMTVEELQHIQDNGHEISCYIWIRADGGSVLNQERIQVQSDRLYERFGFRPGAVLIGSTQWKGWAEPARWLAQAGATADNSFVGSKLDRNPLLNGPFFGFGFGTSYPFYFYENHQRGNERIELIEQPIVGYELGHRASLVDEHTNERETETQSLGDVHTAIDRAIHYHLVMNLFYHPFYIVNYPHCRQAIEEILRYADYKGAHVLHMGNNQVADWWNARARSSITEVVVADHQVLRFTTKCQWPSGMIVKIPLKECRAPKAICDGQPIHDETKKEFGICWAYIPVPSGEHRIEVALGKEVM